MFKKKFRGQLFFLAIITTQEVRLPTFSVVIFIVDFLLLGGRMVAAPPSMRPYS